jgi:hypothetical protein
MRAGVLLAGGVFTARLLGATGANQSACEEDYLRAYVYYDAYSISLFHSALSS